MHFCPKCGSVLIPQSGEKKGRLACACGYKSRDKKDVVLKEKVVLSREEKINVRKKKIETLPKVNAECKRCGGKKAYYWLLQTRSSDESETRFFECVKCGHRWRLY